MTIVDSLVPLMHHDPDRYWITDPDPDTPKGTHFIPGPQSAPYTLVIGFPEGGGGGPRANVGEYRNFMGTLQQISALVVRKLWELRFCSTERRLGTIDCLLDRWQCGGEEEGMFF